MSFESGRISFRLMRVAAGFWTDWELKMGRRAALSDLESLPANGRNVGFSMGGNLLDTVPKALTGGTALVAVRIAERKVQKTLLDAKVKESVRAECTADGKAFIKAKRRQEIRAEVEAELRAMAQPNLQAIPMLFADGMDYFFAGTTGDAAADLLVHLMLSAGFSSPMPVCALTLAKELGAELSGRTETVFSPNPKALSCGFDAGCDFLTWLWFASDTRNGMFRTEAFPEIGVLVEGPLVFKSEDSTGAKTCRLADGSPETSAESKACLMGGKQLRRARITLGADSEQVFSFMLDAATFTVRSLSVPRTDVPLDYYSRLAERVSLLRTWFELFKAVFGVFLKDYAVEADWQKKTVPQIREWIASRPARG